MFNIFARLEVNDQPRAVLNDEHQPPVQLPLMMIMDYLRRNAITTLAITDTSDLEHQNRGTSLLNESSFFDGQSTQVLTEFDLLSDFAPMNGKLEAVILNYEQARRTIDGMTSDSHTHTAPMLPWASDELDFPIFCDELAKSTSLTGLKLSFMRLSPEKIKGLVGALLANPIIHQIELLYCDAALVEAMSVITNRKIIINGLPATQIEALPKNESTSFDGLSMQVISGFLAVGGVALMVVAFVALDAAALSPVGLTVAAIGGVALIASTCGFFSSTSNSSEESNKLKEESTPSCS